MRDWGRKLALMALLGATAMAGCASGPRLFVNPEADMTFYRKVAVLPFSNLSPERFAAARLTRAFVTELIIANRFQIVDEGEFRTELSRIGGEPNIEGHYDPAKLKEAASKLEATGLIRGAVTEYQLVRSGNNEYAVVGFDAEMVDVASGNVVWRISVTKRGKGRLPVLGGGGTRSFGQLTQQACEDAVSKLSSKAF